MHRNVIALFLVIMTVGQITTDATQITKEVKVNHRTERSTRPFSVQRVTTMFRRSLLVDAGGNQILYMRRYIRAYRELSRVFDFFGVVFSFARDDLVSKLTTLTSLRLRDREQGHNNYRTFQRMFTYEHSTNATHLDRPGIYCNRWIHRVLLFISNLIVEVCQEDTAGDFSARVRAQYDAILAPHHSWYVRAAARLALNAFPSRDGFIRSLNLSNNAAGVVTLQRLAAVLENVYNHVQGLYDHYQISTN